MIFSLNIILISFSFRYMRLTLNILFLNKNFRIIQVDIVQIQIINYLTMGNRNVYKPEDDADDSQIKRPGQYEVNHCSTHKFR